MISVTTAETASDLEGILALQKRNLPANLSAIEITEQGFVTIVHSFSELKKLNTAEKHIIAKSNDTVIAYLLAMTTRSKTLVPGLVEMFAFFDQISYKQKPVSEYKYLVVGQVCVETAYRGSGILQQCYNYYKKQYEGKYDFAITEVAGSNTRSLRAHQKNGFEEIARYTGANGTEWCVILWDWKVK
jgi:L-amino acid N-acyltransferase YncA